MSIHMTLSQAPLDYHIGNELIDDRRMLHKEINAKYDCVKQKYIGTTIEAFVIFAINCFMFFICLSLSDTS